MGRINEASIRAKVIAAANGKKVQEKLAKLCEEEARMYAQQAGDAFVRELDSAVTSKLSANAAASIGKSHVEYITGSGGNYVVGVSFGSNRARPSLVPQKYGGVSDIVELLNYGYTASGIVHGYWPNHGYIASRPAYGGAHFVESAIASFPAAAYHVKSISNNL